MRQREHFGASGKPKQAFATKHDAERRATGLRYQQTKNARRKYHAYECGTCGSWHVGRRMPGQP